jgi:hypothetical protein
MWLGGCSTRAHTRRSLDEKSRWARSVDFGTVRIVMVIRPCLQLFFYFVHFFLDY